MFVGGPGHAPSAQDNSFQIIAGTTRLHAAHGKKSRRAAFYPQLQQVGHGILRCEHGIVCTFARTIPDRDIGITQWRARSAMQISCTSIFYALPLFDTALCIRREKWRPLSPKSNQPSPWLHD